MLSLPRTCSLFDLVSNLLDSFHSSCTTDAVLISFAKTLHAVPHKRLLLRLSKLNISADIIDRTTSFLGILYEVVTLDKTPSSFIQVNSSVPRWTVLCSLLSRININDMQTLLPHFDLSQVTDCVVYERIDSANDNFILQNDFDIPPKWCSLRVMNADAAKLLPALIRTHSTPRATSSTPLPLLKGHVTSTWA